MVSFSSPRPPDDQKQKKVKGTLEASGFWSVAGSWCVGSFFTSSRAAPASDSKRNRCSCRRCCDTGARDDTLLRLFFQLGGFVSSGVRTAVTPPPAIVMLSRAAVPASVPVAAQHLYRTFAIAIPNPI